MKRLLFKTANIILIIAHFAAVCCKDVSFADSQGGDYSGSIVGALGSFQGANNGLNHALNSVSADLFTGKAQLSIPLYIPRGNRDISAPLSIAYQSSGGNDLIGVGWSLDLGSINRSIKKGVPKYDSSDIFSAQGEELVDIGSNEYRQKIEGNFVKYSFDGTAWVGVDKGGIKYYFGSNANSRVTTSKGTYSWALDKITDLQGNYLTVDYFKDANTLYPSNISYTANDVTALPAQYAINFAYETRPDTSTSYITGDLVRLLKRLKQIEITFAGKLIRRYIFEYIQSASTTRSLLNKVSEYGSDGITASPPLTFTYRANTGAWSQDQPQWHLPASCQLAGMFDLNGDGLPDVIDTAKQVYLNSKDGFSQTPNWPSIPLDFAASDTGVRFVDLNGDGIPESLKNYAYGKVYNLFVADLVYEKDSYVFKYSDPNNPQWVGSWQWDLPWGVASQYKLNLSGAGDNNFVDGGINFADLNGDGLNDLSVARSEIISWYQPLGDYYVTYSEPAKLATYISTGNGWQLDTRWNSPDGYYVTYDLQSVGDAGRRLADINGDGLADFLAAVNGYKAVYLNNGSGWVRNDGYNIEGDFSATGTCYGQSCLANQGRILVDINADGLVDLVSAKNGSHSVYINTGSGWKRDDSFNIPDGDFLDSETKEQGRYLTDLNGDGAVDLYVSQDSYNKAYLNLTGVPDILIKVSNGLGAETTIEYTASTAFDNYYPNTKLGQLPFVVQAVSKVTSGDARGNFYAITYSYKAGYYDADEREFRGFGSVKVTDAEGNYKESYFKQDDIFKGRLYQQDTSDSSGSLLLRTQNTWAVVQLYTGVNFIYLEQTDNFVYDSADYKQTQTKYEYDDYGNPVKVISYGDVSQPTDDKTRITEYVYNTEDWLISLPKRAFLLDSAGSKVSEKWFYYDGHTNIDDSPVKGLLTKEEAYLYNSLTNTETRVPITYGYDSYGNLTSTADALGRTVTTEYDLFCYSFPVRTTNALGQSVHTVYYGINEPVGDTITGSGHIGQVKSVHDINNQRTYNIYDGLGRLIKVIGPNDTVDSPAVVYEYDFNSQPAKITKRVKTNYDPVQYLSTHQFSDGLGRVIETKSPTEDNPTGQARQIISGIVKYDGRGQIKENYLPYFVNALEDFTAPVYSSPHTSYTYDSLGRLIQATNSDLTYSTTAYSLWKTTTTDENGHFKTQYNDAYGKVIKIEEQNAGQVYRTSYEYDTQGNLVKVTDNQNNITRLYYDSLGRKIKMDDPDMGVWNYEYDLAGNLIKQTDAKGEILTFEYDNLNRLIKKRGEKFTERPISDSNLLLHFNGIDGSNTFTDETGKAVSIFGEAQIDTAQSKFGGSSALLDGMGDYLTLPDSDDWYFGSGDFTIDFWVKFNSFTSVFPTFLSQTRSGGVSQGEPYLYLYMDSMNLYFAAKNSFNEGIDCWCPWEPALNTWYHLAFIRNQTTSLIFIDGVSQVLSGVKDAGNIELGNSTGPLRIGNLAGYLYYFNGWFDEFRISKGIARWTSDFTPPVSEEKNTVKETVLLVDYLYDDTSKSNCIGRLSKVTDQSGSTEFFYDKLGREIESVKKVASSEYRVAREYDALDRLTKLTYPDGEAVSYSYDKNSGLLKSVFPFTFNLSPSTFYVKDITYNATGQISRIQYGNGTETTYTYDSNTLRLDNLVTQSPYGKIQDLNYQFDNTGNIKNLNDYVNTASQSFLYDDLNRLSQAQGSYGTFNYEYDSIGNMTYKEGVNLIYGGIPSPPVGEGQGAGARLPHAVTQFGSTSIDYDANGNMISKGSQSFAYDIENRLTKVEDKNSVLENTTITLNLTQGWNFISLPIIPIDPKISSVLSSITGKYDQVSRYNEVTKTFEHFVNNPKFNQFDTFEYGKGYQIYITDPAGCTLNVTGTIPTTQNVSLKTGYNLIFSSKTTETVVEEALKPLNLSADYSKVLHYNKSSGLFEKYTSTTKEFSALKPAESYYLYLLKDTTWEISNSLSGGTTFVYDGDGGRVKKSTSAPGQQGTSETTYIGSLFERSTVNGQQSTVKHIFAGSQRICSVDSGPLTVDYHYYHFDHLGSSNITTDATGKQTGRYEYTPYGSLSFREPSTETRFPKHLFTGKELDSTGFYYYGARYYDPQIGRFITADTIVPQPYNPQSLNRYSYCDNNPINYIDPTGHGKFSDFWKRVWNEIKAPLIAATVTAAIVFTWGAIAPSMTAGSALFSTSGAVTVSSAAASTAVLNTGEGRQFQQRLGNEVFDDIFGMRPSTARIFGTMGAYMLTNMVFQFGFARLYGVDKTITGVKDYDPSKDKLTTETILKGGKGINYGTRPRINPDTGDIVNADKILYNGNEVVGVAAEALDIGGSQHLGVMMKGLNMSSDMAAFFNNPIKAISQGYLSFGISHTAVNISLLNSGYTTTINSLLKAGWSTVPSTIIYGPYGGGLTGGVAYEQIDRDE